MTEEKKQITQNLMLTVAMLILLVCAAVPILTEWDPARMNYIRWAYAFGAVLALAERLTERYNGSNVRLRRLVRMGKASALCYCVSAFFLLWPAFSSTATYDRRDWLAFLLAGAVIRIYASITYEYVLKKEKKSSQEHSSRKQG